MIHINHFGDSSVSCSRYLVRRATEKCCVTLQVTAAKTTRELLNTIILLFSWEFLIQVFIDGFCKKKQNGLINYIIRKKQFWAEIPTLLNQYYLQDKTR